MATDHQSNHALTTDDHY